MHAQPTRATRAYSLHCVVEALCNAHALATAAGSKTTARRIAAALKLARSAHRHAQLKVDACMDCAPDGAVCPRCGTRGAE